MNFKNLRRNSLVLGTILGAVLVFVAVSSYIGSRELWFTNGDQDSTLLIDSLRVNAGKEPTFVEHPGLGVYLLYGPGLRLLKFANVVHVDNIDEFFAQADPLLELPSLYAGMRHLSIAYVIITASLAGAFLWLVSRSLLGAMLIFVLILGSAGFLFQSLWVRTELSSVFFVTLSLVALAGWARQRPFHGLASCLTAVVAGISLCFGIVSKMVVVALVFPALLSLLGWYFANQNHESSSPSESRKYIHSWTFSGILLWPTVYYFFKILPLGSLDLNKVNLALMGLGTIWAVQGVALLFKRSLVNWTYAPAQFGIGIFLGIPIIFKYCHIESLYAASTSLNAAFSSGMARYGGYVPQLDSGVVAVLDHLHNFLNYSVFTTGFLVTFLLSFSTARKEGRILGSMLILCGIGMSLVMSMRYFREQYLIYPDLFFALGTAVCMAFVNPASRLFAYTPKGLPAAKFGMMALIVLALSNQYRYVFQNYPGFNLGSRNNIRFVSEGCQAAGEYTERLQKRYGTQRDVERRVLSDSRLNGFQQNIRIQDKVYVKDRLKEEGITLNAQGEGVRL
jgi:Dolichyl-phosphate-mannose-protein mannosyltransferase